MKNYQSCFIKNRNILEVVTLTKEVIHQCTKIRQNEYLLKLEFQKAYDMLDWECLKKVLRFTDFDHRWLLWIDLWLSSTKVQILLIGEPGKEIVCKR